MKLIILSALTNGALIIGCAWMLHRYIDMGGHAAMFWSFAVWATISWKIARKEN